MFSQSRQSWRLSKNAWVRLTSDRLKRMASRTLKGIARSQFSARSAVVLAWQGVKSAHKKGAADGGKQRPSLDRRPPQRRDLYLRSSAWLSSVGSFNAFRRLDFGVQELLIELVRSRIGSTWCATFQEKIHWSKEETEEEFHWIIYCTVLLLISWIIALLTANTLLSVGPSEWEWRSCCIVFFWEELMVFIWKMEKLYAWNTLEKHLLPDWSNKKKFLNLSLILS
jgi:hypothetical protein